MNIATFMKSRYLEEVLIKDKQASRVVVRLARSPFYRQTPPLSHQRTRGVQAYRDAF